MSREMWKAKGTVATDTGKRKEIPEFFFLIDTTPVIGETGYELQQRLQRLATFKALMIINPLRNENLKGQVSVSRAKVG